MIEFSYVFSIFFHSSGFCSCLFWPPLLISGRLFSWGLQSLSDPLFPLDAQTLKVLGLTAWGAHVDGVLMLSEPWWEVIGYSLGLVSFSREDSSNCLFHFVAGLKCGLLILGVLLGAELSRAVWGLRIIGFLSRDSLSQVVLPRYLFCFIRRVNMWFPPGSESVPLEDLLGWAYWPGFKDIRALDFQLTRSLALWVTSSSSFLDFPGLSAQNQQDSW